MSTVYSSKDGATPPQPLLIAQFSFQDSTVLYCASVPLNTTEGGFQPATAWGGHDYLARIRQQDIQAVQSRSQQGVDRIPSVTLHLFDPDVNLYVNYEVGHGFKGAILQLSLVTWDADTSTFSSDALVKFRGVCDAPSCEANGDLTVSATSAHNMGTVPIPIIPHEARCPWNFPPSSAQHQDAADNVRSPYYACGYSPTATGANARGTGAFTSCNFTKSDCQARGMYSTDSGARVTRRFGGEQWSPPTREWQSKSYTQGKTVTVFNTRNDQLYGGSYPLIAGTQWFQPAVINSLEDGNATRCEVILYSGFSNSSNLRTAEAGDSARRAVHKVVVNGIEVTEYPGEDQNLMFWIWISDGSRTGNFNNAPMFGNQGDPHGSKACFCVFVFRELGTGILPVRVLGSGPWVLVYTTPTVFTRDFSTNPVWWVLYVLLTSNWLDTEINIQSFINEAPFCDHLITYTDLSGNAAATHRRFICEFAIDGQQRVPAAQVLAGVLNSFGAQLIPSADDGLLKLIIRKSLSDQHPSLPAGSNYAGGGISSPHADGTAGTGYPAYVFDDTNCEIVRGPYCLPTAQVPNRWRVDFQDRDNSYAADSLNIADADGFTRAGGTPSGGQSGGAAVQQTFQHYGISSFDQAIRRANVQLGEDLRGNESNDARGTRFFDIATSFRASHLVGAEIVLFSSVRHQISSQLFRVDEILPKDNYGRMQLRIRWHRDTWYEDAYGQAPARLYSDPGATLAVRPPYPWRPFAEQPIASDARFSTSEWSFSIAQLYGQTADGRTVAQLRISGNLPANKISSIVQPPYVSFQGTTNNTGGTIPGGRTYVFALVGIDANGAASPLSKLCTVAVPAGTNTNTITVPNLFWPSTATSWILFGGPGENSMCEQSSGAGTPSSVTITALNLQTYGPPDLVFDHLLVRYKRGIHTGIFGAPVSAVALNTLTFTGIPFTVNSLAGRIISLVGRSNYTGNLPIADFLITANDNAGNLTVTPNPVGIISLNDVLICRTKATTFTATTIGDSLYVTPYAPSGLTINAEKSNLVRIVRGTGAGQIRKIVSNTATVLTVDTAFDVVPDATSEFWVEEASWTDLPKTDRSQGVQCSVSPVPVLATVDLTNHQLQTVIVEGLSSDKNGKLSIESLAPIRDFYIFGQGEQITRIGNPSSPYTVQPTDINIAVDTSGGAVVVNLLPKVYMPSRPLKIWKDSTADTNSLTVNPNGAEKIGSLSQWSTAVPASPLVVLSNYVPTY